MQGPIADVLDDAFQVVLPPRPYPGLRPFEKHEWPIFFGRERMADAVVAAIVDKKVLVVHGDSGCGKSSLVRAAVMPRLEQENARGGIRWQTCTTTPGGAPLWNLSRAVAELKSGRPDEEAGLEIRRIMNFGRTAPAALADFLGASATHQICVLIDQFEELFDHARHHGAEEASVLTAFCTALHRDPPEGLNVIVTMRSEFLGACARFDDFALTVNATQYLLPRMQHEDLLRAIREPARLFEGDVSRALAERLVADAGGGQDELPLIQHGLMRLHAQHVTSGGPWRLDLEHYRGDATLEGMLSTHADAVMADVQRTLSPAATRLVEDMFRALTDINPDGRAIRRPRTLRQLVAATGADEREVRQVVDAFRAEGISFLRPYGDAPVAADERIDISHEALIRRWKQIADPKQGWLIREFRNGLVWRALLVQTESFERDPSNVLSAATTDERERWLKRRNESWAERYGGGWPRVRALVAASAAARNRQVVRFRVTAGAVLALLIGIAVVLMFQLRTQSTLTRTEERRAQAEFDLKNAARERNEALREANDALEAQRQESARQLALIAEQLQSKPQAGETKAAEQIYAIAETLNAKEPTAPRPAEARAPRVYIHIVDENDRSAAQDFERAFEAQVIDGANIVVPGIELVKSGPPRSALRCFQREECDGEARKILAVANQLLRGPLQLQDLSKRYAGSAGIRPRHYEIWFTDIPRLKSATAR